MSVEMVMGLVGMAGLGLGAWALWRHGVFGETVAQTLKKEAVKVEGIAGVDLTTLRNSAKAILNRIEAVQVCPACASPLVCTPCNTQAPVDSARAQESKGAA